MLLPVSPAPRKSSRLSTKSARKAPKVDTTVKNRAKNQTNSQTARKAAGLWKIPSCMIFMQCRMIGMQKNMFRTKIPRSERVKLGKINTHFTSAATAYITLLAHKKYHKQFDWAHDLTVDSFLASLGVFQTTDDSYNRASILFFEYSTALNRLILENKISKQDFKQSPSPSIDVPTQSQSIAVQNTDDIQKRMEIVQKQV